MSCVVCEKPLIGRQRRFCSLKCKYKAQNAKPSRKQYNRDMQYRRNKFVKKLGDVYDQKGDKGPNWKGGISKDHMRYTKKWRKNNPEKVKVQKETRNAIKRGDIIPKPCVICGETKVDAHHPDYNKPNDIVWLCRKHHVLADRGKLILPQQPT